MHLRKLFNYNYIHIHTMCICESVIEACKSCLIYKLKNSAT